MSALLVYWGQRLMGQKKAGQPSGPRESELVKGILNALEIKPDCYFWRNNTGAFFVGKRMIRFGLKGSADILGILRGGRLCAIEVKTEKGKLSDDQIRFGLLISDYGGLYLVARTVADAIRAVEAALGGNL
jgi:hypothetical protein